MKCRIFSLGYGLMLAAGLAALPSGPVSAQDRSGLGALVLPGDRQAPEKKASDKEALDDALEQYLKESDAALASRMSELRAFFAERKARTRPFAESILSTWGKLSAGFGLMKDIAGEVGVAFGEARAPSQLEKMLADRFRAEVLDPAEARKAVDAAVSGFLGDLKEIEGRLLVKLRADLGDDTLSLPWSPPPMQGLDGGHYESMIRDTVNGVMTDLIVQLSLYVASNHIGNKLAERVVPEDTSDFWKFVTNFAVGIAVDKVVEEASKAAGYDPGKEIAAKIASNIDRMAAAIIDGDPAALQFYPTLSMGRRMHPDQAVRDACKRADEAVVRNGNLGLQVRLGRLRNDRYRRLWTVLTGHLFGAEAAASPFLMYTPLDPAKSSPAEDFIRWADSIAAAYERGGR